MYGGIKIGLALGGGFFRGFAHIGVLQVLKSNGIQADMVAGTSIGAVIGSLYAAGIEPDMLEKIAESCHDNMFYDVALPRRGMFKGEKARTFIKTLTANRDFSQLKLPFCAVACDIESGEKVVLKEGNVGDAVRASVSVPGVFVPFELNGRLLVDGGVINRVPVTEAKDMGADLVIAVDVGARQGRFEVTTMPDVILRTIELMELQCMAAGPPADVVIEPKVRHINMTRLTACLECIEIGRQAAEKSLPEIMAAITAKAAEKPQPKKRARKKNV